MVDVDSRVGTGCRTRIREVDIGGLPEELDRRASPIDAYWLRVFCGAHELSGNTTTALWSLLTIDATTRTGSGSLP